MTSMLFGERLSLKTRVHFVLQLGMSLALALVVCGTAVGQQIDITGRVTSAEGEALRGVTVRVRGTAIRVYTNAEGNYSLSAPPDAVLAFAFIGYRGVEQSIGGRTTIDVVLERSVTVLDEVIVTGYTAQRRGDITGAVSSLNTESATRQTTPTVLKALDGRVPGVTVETSGSPGARTTVRIRGVSSFQNNDPLYIVDGTPVEETYLNWLNPNEIGSIQVLKDASAASIYGSRASNGVVIIETKRGRPGRREATLDVRTGVASPVRGYDDILILNSLAYFDVVKLAHENAGLGVPANIYGNANDPSVPDFIWPNDGVGQSCRAPLAPTDSTCTMAVDPAAYSYPDNLIMPGSPGTNWWDAVFGPGQFRDANLAVSGAGTDNTYHLSLSFFDQEGTARFNRLQRGTARINTSFNLGRVRVGQNLAVSRERRYGGLDDADLGENNIIGKNIFQQPVVPIYDIGGNFASGKALGLSNLTNPLKIAAANRYNIGTNDRIFGNVFGAMDAGPLSVNSRFGFNLASQTFRGYNYTTPENSEVTDIDGIYENYRPMTDWTWWNTLVYTRATDQHNLTVLLGHEANQTTIRFATATCANLVNPDPDSRYIDDALCDPTTKNASSSAPAAATLLSFFGKADYNFGNRYYVNFTLRRDGSSKFGPSHRWGTFPAVGLGWRLSRESFLENSDMFSNVMLRFSWGVTGNQFIPPNRIASQFGGGRGDTFYDIGGTGSALRPGYKITAVGNPDLKWEEQHSLNVGLDLEFLDGRGTFNADVFRRDTKDLLYAPAQPATGGSAAPPIQNIGQMRNTGIDFSLGYRGTIGAGTQWSVAFHGAHYKNKILKIDDQGATFFRGPIALREQNPVINPLDGAIGSFYGLEADGYYLDSLDAAPYWTDGARPGRIRFVDQPTVLDSIACPAAPGCVGLYRPDGQITAADRVIIGSPHPDFTAGLDLSVRRGDWELSATLFATFGNEIFNSQKYWTVFRYFDTNVAADRLANAVVLDSVCAGSTCPGRVTNPNAKYPRVDGSDVFSRQFSSYWVEDGSYVRLRTLQLSYHVPPSIIRWIPAARVYLQAENLFTITGYSGLDPSLPSPEVYNAVGEIRDQFRGVDQGSYPASRTITIGISTTF